MTSHSIPDPAPDLAPVLEASQDGPVLVLALNRPERLNAVTLELYRVLQETLARAEADAGVRAVVLTGRGRAFSVGADLVAHGGGDPSREERRRYVEAGQAANRALQASPLPVVAAVNGHAVGAGLELALSADLVVVARESRLRFPEAALGTFVGGGVTLTLPARVGMARARELLLLAEFLSPDEALAMGMVNRVVPAEEVVPAALALAGTLATRAPRSLAALKSLLSRPPAPDPGLRFQEEAEALLTCMESPDWREGVRAFHEKRAPRFTGA
jgi:enoyl-CoA hydratase